MSNMDTRTLLEKDADGKIVLRWNIDILRDLAQYQYLESLPMPERARLWPMKEDFLYSEPPRVVLDETDDESFEEEPPKKPLWEPREPPKSKAVRDFEREGEESMKRMEKLMRPKRAEMGFPSRPVNAREEAERELEENIGRYFDNFKKRRRLLRYSKMSQRDKTAFLSRFYACGICGCGRNGERLVIEHDHDRDLVRGVVCEKCNHLPALTKHAD